MAEEINELPKSKPLRDKKKKFANNFIENGGDARKAALDAGYGEQYVRDKLWQIIEDPAVQAKITQALSKEETGSSTAEGLGFQIREHTARWAIS